MVAYYKYLDAVIEKLKLIGERAESKWWDWRKNVKDLFENAERYHFECKLWDNDSIYLRYYTSKNENNLVSFTLYKEGWEFKCNSAIWFPSDYSEEKQHDVTYKVYRDCLDDLERLEDSKKD